MKIIYANVDPEKSQGYYWMDAIVLWSNGLVEEIQEGYKTLADAVKAMNSHRVTQL